MTIVSVHLSHNFFASQVLLTFTARFHHPKLPLGNCSSPRVLFLSHKLINGNNLLLSEMGLSSSFPLSSPLSTNSLNPFLWVHVKLFQLVHIWNDPEKKEEHFVLPLNFRWTAQTNLFNKGWKWIETGKREPLCFMIITSGVADEDVKL